ncbi:MAG TPA: cyclase, partial [Mycobacterium sp.]|nr:cyclase [Mycobacterium sp.]
AQHVVPLLAPVIGIPSDAGYEPVAAEGRKLYELIATGVRDYLLACFGGGAGLLIAEDLHWFDPSTKETVAWLLGASVGRLLVVITGRPGEWLPNEWPVKVFDLQPLTGEQADSLITALGPDLSPEDRAAVRLRSDGLPLYIEQLVRGLADEPADSSAETRVPDALYEPLFARLRARADVVPIVEAAGIIGRHVDRGLLSTVCAMSEDDVDDIIDELEDALVLEPWGIDGWRFRHELLREVAAELAPPSVSRALHRKVADALVQGIDGGDPDWRLVASHYEQAERFDESVWAYRQAASAARRRGAVAEARTDLSLALSALDRAKPGPDRDRRELAVRLERGFLVATVEGYHSRAAIDDFDRCLQLSGTDPCRDEFVATTVALIGYHFTRADLRQLVEGFEALQASLQQGRPWLHPVIEAGFGVVTCVRGDFDTPTAHIEGAISSLTAASREQIMAVWGGPNDPIVTATLHLVLTRFVQGDLTGAEATLGQVAGLVEGLGFPQGPFTRAYTQFMEAWMRIEAGQLDRAAELDTDLMGQAERHGFDIWLLWAGTQLAAVRALAEIGAQETDLSKLAEQASIMANLIGALRSVGAEIYVTMFDSLLARVLIAMGETDRARDRIDAALALAENSGSHFYDAELLRLRAATHADPDACRADIAAALELARRQGATLFELRAALDDFRLRGESARTEIIDAVGRLPADSAFPELAQAQPLCRQ